MLHDVNDALQNSRDRLVRIGTIARMTGLPITYLRRLADEGLLPVCRRGCRCHRRFPCGETIDRARTLMRGQ